MIPLTALLRRQPVLATSHTSVRWVMLERLASHLPVPSFIAVARDLLLFARLRLVPGGMDSQMGSPL